MTTEPAAPAVTALRRERQMALYKRALERLPGGTNSNFRAWGDDTVYIDRGKGGTVWDMDGNEFIDLRSATARSFSVTTTRGSTTTSTSGCASASASP